MGLYFRSENCQFFSNSPMPKRRKRSTEEKTTDQSQRTSPCARTSFVYNPSLHEALNLSFTEQSPIHNSARISYSAPSPSAFPRRTTTRQDKGNEAAHPKILHFPKNLLPQIKEQIIPAGRTNSNWALRERNATRMESPRLAPPPAERPAQQFGARSLFLGVRWKQPRGAVDSRFRHASRTPSCTAHGPPGGPF